MLKNKGKTQEKGWVFLNTPKSISLSQNSFSNSRVIPNCLLTCLCWCLVDISIKHTQTEIQTHLHKHPHDPYPNHQKSSGSPPEFIFNPITSHYFPLPLGHGHLSPPLLPPSQFPLFPGYLFSTQWPGNPCRLKTNVQNLVVVLHFVQSKILYPFNNLQGVVQSCDTQTLHLVPPFLFKLCFSYTGLLHPQTCQETSYAGAFALAISSACEDLLLATHLGNSFTLSRSQLTPTFSARPNCTTLSNHGNCAVSSHPPELTLPDHIFIFSRNFHLYNLFVNYTHCLPSSQMSNHTS